MHAFSLAQTIGGSYPADPGDVLRAKKGLNRLGFYAVPKYGMTPWPDEGLFEGLKSFQRKNDLAVDGVREIRGQYTDFSGSGFLWPTRSSRFRFPTCFGFQFF